MKSSQSLRMENRYLAHFSPGQKAPKFQKYPVTISAVTFNENYEAIIPSQTKDSQKIKHKAWTQLEQLFHTQFWIQKFIQNPHQNFSLDAPLNRKSYNKQASDYIQRKSKILKSQCFKSAEQCKSKFATIRRKVKKNRKKLQNIQGDFGFIDFMLLKAEKLIPLSDSLWDKILKLKQLRQNQGPFVKIALEENRFQKSSLFQDAFIKLSDYVENHENQQILELQQ